jgi:hypothetical protein
MAALMVLSVGCGGATTVVARPMVAENRRPEARELPQDPAQEALPEGIPTDPPETHVEALEAGSCVSEDGSTVAQGPCPAASGLVISEARAARDALYRIRYPELRRTYQADRQVWSAHRELYETQIQEDREEIRRLQPGWWEEHDGTIMGVVGLVLGAAITTAITVAVQEVTD